MLNLLISLKPYVAVRKMPFKKFVDKKLFFKHFQQMFFEKYEINRFL